MDNVTPSEVSAACASLREFGVDPATATRGDIRHACNVGDRRARTIREWIRRSGSVETKQQEVGSGEWVVPVSNTKVLLRMIDSCKEVIKNEVDDLKREAMLEAREYTPVAKKPVTGNMLEISIPDLHAGKLAWGKETLWGNYDLKIAEKVFEEALEALIARTASYQFDEILIVVGNDLIHSDSMSGTTTKGTPLDNDGRYQRTFKKVRLMVTRAIERLRLMAPVSVMLVPGNHDQLSVWHLGDSLECLFAKCDDVAVDNAPSLRKYYQWGNNMIMFTHGNKGSLTDYPLLMAVEQPKMFGETIYREAHTGDKHQLKVHELHGVRVRISPALCPPDAWHSENMFVGNPRSAEAFVWNKEEGLVGTAVYTVPNPKEANQG